MEFTLSSFSFFFFFFLGRGGWGGVVTADFLLLVVLGFFSHVVNRSSLGEVLGWLVGVRSAYNWVFCQALDGLEATRSVVRTQRVWGLICGPVCFCPVEIAGFLPGN